ncbi:MAG: type II toxin-antitoxin system RelE/ParE family toxin [Actinomycetota bacterium]|nr:type II toxin-antitoxin system RelE/ParE family toxin [Actinomycetota bacterium]
MTDTPWDLVVAGAARRSVDRLPEKIAIAVLDFLLGPLLENPHRVGKPLRGELRGLHSARVGAYRVVYEISAGDHIVKVVYIDHRADVYRPR